MSVVARRPATVGAFAPSSVPLAERLASVVPRSAGTVVELGPGTGPVSAAIHRRLAVGVRHIGVEIDEQLVEYLRANQVPLDVVHGDAGDLRALLAERGIQRVDAVVSGLPWAVFDTHRQRRILGEVASVLDPDGVFTTFAYLHALPSRPARRFRAMLRSHFDEVLMTTSVWRNLPPAVTYVCRRVKPDAELG